MARNILKKKQKKTKSKKTAFMQFIFLALAAAFLFALTFYFRQQAGKYLPTPVALSIEVTVEFVILFLLALIFSPQVLKTLTFHTKGIQFAAMGGAAVAIGVVLNFLALRTGFLSKVVAITSPSQIIFGLIIAFILAGESFTFKQIIGTIISIVGLLLIVLK